MVNVITDTAALEAFCTSLAHETFITVDTEFMREKTYYPQLCLVQVSGETNAAAIDPLAPGIDLKPLFDLLANPAVLKVFHACRQDMEIFYHASGGVIPAPMFDTQIAAMVCGYGESVSYETLVNKILRAPLDKSSRFTDWSRRPLTDKQLVYALDDVLHLRKIYLELSQRLADMGRKEWIAEEMQPLLDPLTYDNDPNEAWKKIRVRNASPRYLAALQATACWRELLARERNVPRSRIMKDETLAEVAHSRPEDFAALQAIRGFHPTMSAVNYEPLFALWKEVEAMPPSSYPRMPAKPQMTGNSDVLADLLRMLLKNCAYQHQVVPRLIADKDDLDMLAMGKRDGVKTLQGWRYELFGAQALKLLEGKIALKADGENGVAFVEI
ncbi:MAG TPA: ribonuclease D [Rickettsiales bacterium]|nr:ribonuclease D [Rickettsiales bacterium]